jgi:hypothetical protein
MIPLKSNAECGRWCLASVIVGVVVLQMAAPALASVEFVHPGALDTSQELAFVRAQVNAGREPWCGELNRLKGSAYASRAPHGKSTINSKGEDAGLSRDDAISAYGQALLWSITGDELYARRAVAILDSWSGLTGFTAGTEQDRLQAGWVGAVFGSAAELMRGYPKWPTQRSDALRRMFARAFYPQLNTPSFWNGNVDLTQIDAIMTLAVFNDDQDEFALGLERLRIRCRAYIYLRSDGPAPAHIAGDNGNVQKFWYNPQLWPDGLTQETCRDNGHHAQFGLGSALHAAEIAWHQGVDVYGENRERFTAAMELLSSQLATGSMGGVDAGNATKDLYDTFEVGYNHYHNRLGIDLPNTRRLIELRVRPSSERASWNLVFETLTHADLPAK